MLPTQAEKINDHNKGNDPKGDIYFYYNSDKKSVFIRIHTDSKSMIDRKVRDSDRQHYKEQWDKFNKDRNKNTGSAKK